MCKSAVQVSSRSLSRNTYKLHYGHSCFEHAQKIKAALSDLPQYKYDYIYDEPQKCPVIEIVRNRSSKS